MRNFLKTTLAFSKKVATTGALFETSRHVVAAITQPVTPQTRQVIVEYGAGHGNITRGILAKMHPDSVLLAFELHREFCEVLQQNVQDSRLRVINDSAAELPRYLAQYQLSSVDVIVSAIPLTILPPDLCHQIMREGHRLLSPNGTFMQVFYSLRALGRFRQHFAHVGYQSVWRNMPPAWIYTCTK